MSTLERLLAADALKFGFIDCRFRVGALGPFDVFSEPFCSRKEPGSLRLTLTAEQLGIPARDLPLPFVGEREGENVVRWRIDLDVDTWVLGVRVTHVAGHLLCELDDVDPGPLTLCDGSRRLQEVRMRLVSGRLELATSIGQGVVEDFRADPIDVGERFGDLTGFLRLELDWQTDGCGELFQVAGTHVPVIGVIDGLRYAGELAAQVWTWSRTGSAWIDVSPPSSSRILTFHAPGPFSVTAEVELMDSVHGPLRLRRTLSGVVITAEEAEAKRAQCELNRHFRNRVGRSSEHVIVVRGSREGRTVGGIRIVDPLWDPRPDERAVLQVLPSIEELERRRDDVKSLTKQVEATSALLSRAIDARRKAAKVAAEVPTAVAATDEAHKKPR